MLLVSPFAPGPTASDCCRNASACARGIPMSSQGESKIGICLGKALADSITFSLILL